MTLTEEHVHHAVLGGTLLGGGGGGSAELGRELGVEAIKHGGAVLLDIDEIEPEKILITCSLVGAPAAKNICVRPVDYVESFDILEQNFKRPIAGIIANECGAVACVNGWLQAAVKKIPVIDAPGNGRAHPTAAMGSMGLHTNRKYVSMQGVAGGDRETNSYVSGFIAGSIENVSSAVRSLSALAGGMVAVARNPVEVSYVKANGAPGAIRQAIKVGKAMDRTRSSGSEVVAAAAMEILGGEIVCKDRVSSLHIITEGGFDVGNLKIGKYDIVFCNEYLTIDSATEGRIATFPDLIALVDATDGTPVTSAGLRERQCVYLLNVPARRLLLGQGMFYRKLYESVEKISGKKLFDHLRIP